MTATSGTTVVASAYDDSLLLRDARARYFEDNGFGADGGYAKKWEVVKMGPLPIPIPNVEGRKQALCYHDLHHIVSGYRTDWTGEFEISAFELGAGCGKLWFAWLINLTGVVGGMFLCPRRTFRAFVRGRRAQALYRIPYSDALLERRVGEVRRELGLDVAPGKARAADVALFGAALLMGGAVGSFHLALGLSPFLAVAYAMAS